MRCVEQGAAAIQGGKPLAGGEDVIREQICCTDEISRLPYTKLHKTRRMVNDITNVPMKSDERLQDRFELYSTIQRCVAIAIKLLDGSRKSFQSAHDLPSCTIHK